MLNIGNPELAFKTSFLPNDGVGLARMEFIITEYIKAHPMALIHPNECKIPRTEPNQRIDTQLRKNPKTSSSTPVGRRGHHCRGFLSQTVVVRMSDFKTNEYATLLGGAGSS